MAGGRVVGGAFSLLVDCVEDWLEVVVAWVSCNGGEEDKDCEGTTDTVGRGVDENSSCTICRRKLERGCGVEDVLSPVLLLIVR